MIYYFNFKYNFCEKNVLLPSDENFSILPKYILLSRITEIEYKMPGVTGLVTNAFLNTKTKGSENKRSDITDLVAKAALNTKAVEDGKKNT